MHYNAHQFVHWVYGGFWVSGCHSEFEWEGYLPNQFGDAAFVLIIFKAAQVNREEIGQSFDVRGLHGLYQFSAFVTFELVSSCQFFTLAVIADAVVQRYVRFGENQRQVYFFLLALSYWIMKSEPVWQTRHSVTVTLFEKNSYSSGVGGLCFPFSFLSLSLPFIWSLMEFISQI